MPFHIGAAEPHAPDGAPTLDARVLPNDSLGPRGFFIFAGAVLAILAVIDVAMLSLGYWPIALFVVVDGAFLLTAGVLCRRTRERSERILIFAGAVCISRFDRDRLVHQKRLPVFGLVVEREDDPDFGCQRLSLVLRGVRHCIAADLGPHERDAFARHLADALTAAGGSPRVRIIETLPLVRSMPSYAQ